MYSINNIHKIELEKGFDLQSDQLPQQPYIALVLADFSVLSAPFMNKISEVLVESCVMWVDGRGQDSTLLDDAVDMYCVMREIERPASYKLVHTTWGKTESLDEMIETMDLLHLVDDAWNVDRYDLAIISIET